MELPGVSKKKHAEFLGLIKNAVKSPGGDQENVIWNFAVGFQHNFVDFQALLCLEFPAVK